jgi:hypothetical protein
MKFRFALHWVKSELVPYNATKSSKESQAQCGTRCRSAPALYLDEIVLELLLGGAVYNPAARSIPKYIAIKFQLPQTNMGSKA